jgi:hypothetical protein
MLSRRWGCSIEEVGRRLGEKVEAAGLADPQSTRTITARDAIAGHLAQHGPPTTWYTLGVTDDDRIFVLDANDRPLLEL